MAASKADSVARMSFWDGVLILAGGLFAGVVNSMAGGGSLLTVPLLALAGVEGLLANGTNRVAVLIQSGSAGVGFARKGAVTWAQVRPILAAVVAGGLVGSFVVSGLDDEVFERVFGLLMLPLLGLSLWKPKAEKAAEPWPMWLTTVVFFGIGIYAGAIQAGVGLILVLVLSRVGYDLVTANAIKVWAVVAVSIVACVVFITKDQVRWGPALVLSVGTGLGGYLGSQIAVEGGDRIIKPVLVVSVLALSGRMLGLY